MLNCSNIVNVVRMLFECCSNAVETLPKCRSNAIQMLFECRFNDLMVQCFFVDFGQLAGRLSENTPFPCKIKNLAIILDR